ncbi:4a-hydroxytetrahydrobiopterin dehydratase [Candidatus Pacearchaeota archaeon]|nr:MAG: 4a-hydroxytetrahydrobiopterin dehydratase [Candidatus Pacearchaeota archaeon]
MLSLKEISDEMESLDNWSLESGTAISKVFEFSNFKEAIEFVNKVAEVAEAHSHHPDIVITFNRVRLALTTHDEHGLTKKDFEVAREIDRIK